jgi:hypothetical protein
MSAAAPEELYVRALGGDALFLRDRGARALLGSVFGPIPWSGRWQAALLLDGNIGIGGRPIALLKRVRELLSSTGIVICELKPPEAPTTCEASHGLEAPP